MPSSPNQATLLARAIRAAVLAAPDGVAVVRPAFAQARAAAGIAQAEALDRLIAAGAFNDAALVLLQIALPAWKLRRLVYDDGAWHCALSRYPDLPIDTDETADASHEILAVAILGAIGAAQQRARGARRAGVPAARRKDGEHVHCCDNIA